MRRIAFLEKSARSHIQPARANASRRQPATFSLERGHDSVTAAPESLWLYRVAAPCRARGSANMIHKGIQFSLEQTATPEIWGWEYRIGRHIKTGRLKAASRKLALRGVHRKIDHDLRDIHLRSTGDRAECG